MKLKEIPKNSILHLDGQDLNIDDDYLFEEVAYGEKELHTEYYVVYPNDIPYHLTGEEEVEEYKNGFKVLKRLW